MVFLTDDCELQNSDDGGILPLAWIALSLAFFVLIVTALDAGPGTPASGEDWHGNVARSVDAHE